MGKRGSKLLYIGNNKGELKRMFGRRKGVVIRRLPVSMQKKEHKKYGVYRRKKRR